MLRWTVFLISALALGDTLTLKDGRVISGTYLGGTTTAICFLSADWVETVSIGNIQRITFDPGAISSSASPAISPASVPPAPTISDVANKNNAFAKLSKAFAKRRCG